MKNTLFLCVALALIGCNDLRTVVPADGGIVLDDGGPRPDAPFLNEQPCVDVDVRECDGNTLRFCDNGALEVVDCTTLYPSPARASCQTIPALGGAVCALSPGDPCVYDTASGTHFAACAGSNAGCVWTATGSECQENTGGCGSGDQVWCNDERLVYGCSAPAGAAGQPILIDCPALGGTCSAPSCIGLPESAQCVLPTLLCAADLTCEEGACAADDPVTIRSCSGSTMSGACTNTADCAIIDGNPQGIFSTGIGCLSAPDVGACVEAMTGLSAACSDCFATPEGDAFRSCAGF